MNLQIIKKIIVGVVIFSFSPLALASGSSGGGSAGVSGGGAAGGVNVVQKSEASSDSVRDARKELRERMNKKLAIGGALGVIPAATLVGEFDHSHRALADVLKANVKFNGEKTSSGFDYKNFNPRSLSDYLAKVESVTKFQFDQFSRDQQLAFLINVYNAQTVLRVKSHYPVSSIKQLGSGFPFFVSPWKIKFFKLFGEEAYLDKIEHELVRETNRYNDPRIHFAFNCASIGCPALLDEPFVAEKLEDQLHTAAENFLKDHTRNYYDSKKKTFYISEIFKWYRGDFEKGHMGIHSLENFLKQHASTFSDDPKVVDEIQTGSFNIQYLDYNWNLNDIATVNTRISQRERNQ